MKFSHPALCLAVAGGVLALSACGNAADKLSDNELRSLLRSDSASANAVRPPMDRSAVECLGVWSGDSESLHELPAGTDTTALKANCRQHVEGWLADAERNPHRLTFGELATARTARRARALLDEPASGSPPAKTIAHAAPASPAPATAPATPPSAKTVRESAGSEQAFNGALDRYESLCEQARDIAKKAKSPPMILNRHINDCLQRSSRLRAQMSAATAKGNAFETSMIAQNAQRIVAGAQRLVNEAKKAAR
ncbi:MAG: hypothetical protein WBV61_01820 [Rhodanobacteraceae bacterium]